MFWSSERSNDWMWYHWVGANGSAAWDGGMYVDVEDGDEVDVTASLGDVGLPGVLIGDVVDI